MEPAESEVVLPIVDEKTAHIVYISREDFREPAYVLIKTLEDGVWTDWTQAELAWNAVTTPQASLNFFRFEDQDELPRGIWEVRIQENQEPDDSANSEEMDEYLRTDGSITSDLTLVGAMFVQEVHRIMGVQARPRVIELAPAQEDSMGSMVTIDSSTEIE